MHHRAYAAAFSIMLSLTVMGTASTAEKADPAWGTYAGMHLGNAEGASSCPGFKLNGARRDEVIKIIKSANLTRPFEAARIKRRKEREAAISKDGKVCDGLWAAYGPKGLVSRHYLLRTGSPDVPETSAFERGIEMGLDPRDLESFQWTTYKAAAALIVSKCSGYDLTPIAEGMIQSRTSEEVDPFFAQVMGQTFEKNYGKLSSPHFCQKILADYGPDGDTPLFVKKK